MSKPSIYHKFKVRGFIRAGFSSVSSHSLWEASDHLLVLRRSGFILEFSESYQRFFYDSIRSVECVENDKYAQKQQFLGLILAVGLLANLLGILIIAGGGDTQLMVAAIFFFILGAPMFVLSLIGFIANRRRGATCDTYLNTESGRHLVPCLGTKQAAREITEWLTPRIEKVQGQYDRQAHLNKVAETHVAISPSETPPATLPNHFMEPPPLPQHARGALSKWVSRVTWATLTALALSGVISLVDLLVESVFTTFLSLLVFASLFFLNAVGLIQSIKFSLRTVYRNYHLGLLAYIFGMTVIGYIFFYYYIIAYERVSASGGDLMLELARFPALSDTFMTVVYLLNILGCFVLVATLIAIMRKGVAEEGFPNSKTSERESKGSVL